MRTLSFVTGLAALVFLAVPAMAQQQIPAGMPGQRGGMVDGQIPSMPPSENFIPRPAPPRDPATPPPPRVQDSMPPALQPLPPSLQPENLSKYRQ
jgi:hypothetical protein